MKFAPLANLSLHRMVPLLAVLVLLVWSALFAATYRYSFYWDDLHLVRPYSSGELASVFHGRHDLDGIETNALRPVTTLLFAFQAAVFDENVVLHRVFMVLLMCGLLWAVGLLLLEGGLSRRHVSVIFLLFAASRVFTALLLWVTLGALILCYILMVLSALFYLRWIKTPGAPHLLAWSLGFATLAIFTREEAYTLPAVLPLVWWISSTRAGEWKRPAVGALGVGLVLVVHLLLRRVFVPDAPPVDSSLENLRVYFWPALQSAWMPGGREYVGTADRLIAVTWQVFLGALLGALACISGNRVRAQFLGLGVLGLIVCTPALGVARSFGVTLPALAFLTAIATAIVSAYERASDGASANAEPALRPHGADPALRGRAWRGVIAGILLLGLTIGVGGGVRRSFYVAEAMHENSVTRVLRDGRFVFDGYPVRLTIPAKRREAKLARLATFGIRSREDLERLESLLANDTSPYRQNRAAKSPLFLEKYDYLSF